MVYYPSQGTPEEVPNIPAKRQKLDLSPSGESEHPTKEAEPKVEEDSLDQQTDAADKLPPHIQERNASKEYIESNLFDT